MLTLMEEKKLIRRTSVERDGRYKKIELEPRGVQLHEMCLSIREEVERRFTAALTAEEAAQFKALVPQDPAKSGVSFLQPNSLPAYKKKGVVR